MRSSRSTSEMIAPAMKAPRITSSPSDSASAAKPTSSTSDARTRICAVVSCRRTRSSRRRRECSAPRTARKTAAARPNSPPSSSSVAPVPPSPEKKIESRMIAPKSAIEAAAMISCPKVVESCPESLSTGTSTPSEVAQRMIATSSGVSTRSTACRPNETASATASEIAKPVSVSLRTCPRSLPNSISSPARKSTNARPSSATTSTASSTSTQPSPDGPTTMPATISSTTEGSSSAREEPEQERRREGDRHDDEEVARSRASGQPRATERRAERAAPDHDRPPLVRDVVGDPVLLVAAVALQRAEVDRAVGAAVRGVAGDEPDTQVGARGGLEPGQREVALRRPTSTTEATPSVWCSSARKSPRASAAPLTTVSSATRSRTVVSPR